MDDFDDDEALDYIIIYEDIEKDSNNDQSKKATSGCLGLILILVIPSTLLGIAVSYL